jgi:hypothetical protein
MSGLRHLRKYQPDILYIEGMVLDICLKAWLQRLTCDNSCVCDSCCALSVFEIDGCHVEVQALQHLPVP